MIKHELHPPYLIQKWMDFWNYAGLATPWNTIYYRNAKLYMDGRLRKHELMHIEQMKRDGVLKYMVMYNWYWITIGYENNPYEIEAREAENGI